jgi:hypothetical protein
MVNFKNFPARLKGHLLFTISKPSLIVTAYNLFSRPLARAFFRRNIRKNRPVDNYLTYNSKNKRSIAVLEKDKKHDEVIITCYFTKKADPLLDVIRSTPDIKYIEPWYNSIVSLKLNGIIIHDGIDKDFIEKYQNQYVQFREYAPGDYSIFEERWFAYYKFLSETNIKKVFFTDISDVIIPANPFSMIREPFALYIGRDHANKIGVSPWALAELNNYLEDAKHKVRRSFYYQQVYNVGVAGGSKQLMLFFISRIIDLILLTTTNRHKDMTLANMVIHKYFFPKLKLSFFEPAATPVERDTYISHKYLISGFPVNSAFNKFEIDSKAFFIHK